MAEERDRTVGERLGGDGGRRGRPQSASRGASGGASRDDVPQRDGDRRIGEQGAGARNERANGRIGGRGSGAGNRGGDRRTSERGTGGGGRGGERRARDRQERGGGSGEDRRGRERGPSRASQGGSRRVRERQGGGDAAATERRGRQRGDGRATRGDQWSARGGREPRERNDDRRDERRGVAPGNRRFGRQDTTPARRRRDSDAQRDRRAPRRGSAKRDVPVIDDQVTGRELDPEIRQELSTLGSGVAGTVARHLVMAGQLIDSDPDLAYRHAQEARRMAGRVAVVREAAGQTAYAAERYAEALAELRAARRINGSVAFLPMMADSERGLGHPERALELADSPDVAHLDSAGKAEMLIVAAGAYKDLGNLDEALRTLQVRALTSRRQGTWVARLRYAYADLLLDAGRKDEAIEWFTRVIEADVEGETDADERLADLTGMTIVATNDEDNGSNDEFLAQLPDSTESDR
jgi:hypothetical protein